MSCSITASRSAFAADGGAAPATAGTGSGRRAISASNASTRWIRSAAGCGGGEPSLKRRRPVCAMVGYKHKVRPGPHGDHDQREHGDDQCGNAQFRSGEQRYRIPQAVRGEARPVRDSDRTTVRRRGPSAASSAPSSSMPSREAAARISAWRAAGMTPRFFQPCTVVTGMSNLDAIGLIPPNRSTTRSVAAAATAVGDVTVSSISIGPTQLDAAAIQIAHRRPV